MLAYGNVDHEDVENESDLYCVMLNCMKSQYAMKKGLRRHAILVLWVARCTIVSRKTLLLFIWMLVMFVQTLSFHVRHMFCCGM